MTQETIAQYGDLWLLYKHYSGRCAGRYVVELSGRDCHRETELHSSRDFYPARVAYDALKKAFQELEIELGDPSVRDHEFD